ncbi:hypothetical protein [uncultured Dysosmobacter sp.]|uniref:hypothetical protein n=1 Tax=uncultured Dysosmobacter sp. TaxID=2591384 RepID=UPI002636FAF4|nr:hypothetical protein [uncultured Dysosmobacter sp.]
MKKIRYKLYAMKVSQEGLQRAERERFFMVTPTHILIYRRPWRKMPEGVKAVAPDIRLSEKETEWLRECNLSIMRAFAEKHEQTAAAGMESFVDAFERELMAEREKLGAEAPA